MAHLLPNAKQKFFDANGAPLAGGKLYTYQAGTSTPLVTYQDALETTPNTNPIILDANGEATIFINNNGYKFVLKTPADIVLWTVDGVKTFFDGELGTSVLADNAVTNDKLADDAVSTTKIQDVAVTTAKIDDGAVTTPKIHDDAVTTAKIADSNVTTAKIADANVTTAKVADGAITPAKLSWGVTSSVSAAMPSGYFSTTSFSFTAVSNLTVSITTIGRPVLVFLTAANGTTRSVLRASNSSGSAGTPLALLKITRNGTDIGSFSAQASDAAYANVEIPASSIHLFDAPAAGTYTYAVTLAAGASNVTATLQGCLLVAVQL